MTDILVVCTANVARSPLFAARLRLEADQRLGPGAVDIASAGVDTVYGKAAAGHAVTVADRWGADLSQHRSTPTNFLTLHEPALIITMERRHGRALLERDPKAAHTFTLPELVTILADQATSGEAKGLPPADPAEPRSRIAAVADLAAKLRPKRLSRRRADVPDPIRGGQNVYDALGERFTEEGTTLAQALFGPLAAETTKDVTD